ncbi:MAG TPA: MATE family efflux transporter [Novosphingobium sp.]|nr:MATE family efflux transporter [Novosphingobium sp.]
MNASALAEQLDGKTGSVLDRKETVRLAILTGPILPTLLRLSLPTIAVLVAQTLVGIAETYYVSRLGTDALVGVSVVFPVWMLMTMMSAGGLGGGVASAVARAIGSGRTQDADDHLLHAIVLGTFMGTSFMLGMWLFGGGLFAKLGATNGALRQALSYSNWLFVSAIPIWIVNLCSAALRGVGNVRSPALVTLFGAIVLIPLSPLLIFGFGPFKGFGIAGAGIAVALYYGTACVVLISHLLGSHAGLTFRIRPLRWRLFREVLSVGVISSLSAVQLNLTVVLMTATVGHFGAAALAGYGVGSRLDYLFIPVLFGLGSAVLTMVGTSIGADNLVRAKRVALVGTALGAGFTGIIGLAVAVYPPLWLNIFTSDPVVLETGQTYLHAVAPFYVAMGTTFILGFVSQGAGRPGWTTFAGTIRLIVSAGVSWIAVEAWNADLQSISFIIAAGQVSAALVCLAALRFGLIWPPRAISANSC